MGPESALSEREALPQMWELDLEPIDTARLDSTMTVESGGVNWLLEFFFGTR